jgi:hypothetical protein
MIELIGRPTLAALFSAAHLIRSGGYFLRIALATRYVVEEDYQPITTACGAADRALCIEFLLMTDAASWKLDQPRARRIMLATDFVDVFNGGFWAWVWSAFTLQHWCAGLVCCASRSITKLRMVKALLNYLLPRRPDIPELQRWLLIGPSCCFFLRLAVIHRLLQRLLDVAFSDITVVLNDAVTAHEAAMRNGEHEYQDSFEWHATSGKRLRSVKEFIADQSNHVSMFFLTLLFWKIINPAGLRYVLGGVEGCRSISDLEREWLEPKWLEL